MEEIKELILKDLEERKETHLCLIKDLKEAINFDITESVLREVQPRPWRFILGLLLEADSKRKQPRYTVTSIESAVAYIRKNDPEFIESVTRKYDRKK